MMTASPILVRRLFALLCGLVLAGSCGRDRMVAAGGTSGAEAENAVSARVVGLDGSPVRGALVKARASTSLSDSVHLVAATDSAGLAVLPLSAAVDWRLDVASDTFAAQISIHPGEDRSVVRSVSLARRAHLSGRLLGLRPGSVVRLAGLGRSATLDSGLHFGFSDLPSGQVDLRAAEASWVLTLVPGDTLRVSLDTASRGSLAGDPAELLLHAQNLPQSVGADALVSLEFQVPAALAGSVTRLKLVAKGPQGDMVLPVQIAAWDPLSRKVRLWTRTGTQAGGGSLVLALDTLGSGEVASNPFRGRGMANSVLFSLAPTKNGTSDSWENFTQSGRDLVVTSTVAWQTDATDPLGSGIVSSDQSQMLLLGRNLVTADLSRVSVRLRFLSGWQRWARILQISDTAGLPLVQLVRNGDTLVSSGTRSSSAVFVKSDTLWHTYTWERTGSQWRLLVDARHLLGIDDPAIVPASIGLAEGGRIRMSELMLWADTTVREMIPVGGQAVSTVVAPVR
ncbi:MAG: hypothetical protein IPN71_06450 [Fibrobacteres bacterium]|jgi:hypothetical protein|nr:hypothetical protein [Fibrobacterota bacterium]